MTIPGRWFRFEDGELQSALLEELERAAVRYSLDGTGAVRYENSQATSVADAAVRVRNTKFQWYLIRWQTRRHADGFRDSLVKAGLAFFVEHAESGTWFSVRRSDRARHDQLFKEMLATAGARGWG